MKDTICGFIAIIGRPNVGKSTLLNKLIEEKISITSRKPQTTRDQISGIKTEGNYQIIYVDTPGIHRDEKQALNRLMNREAFNAIKDVHGIVFVIDAFSFREEDEFVLRKLKDLHIPVILAVNKVDKIHPKEKLLAYLEEVSNKMSFFQIIPISAQKGTNIKELEKQIKKILPAGPFLFPPDEITDKNEKFLVAEIIREKLIRNLGDELPYTTSVIVESFSHINGLLKISAVIFVAREGQKPIVIGTEGQTLKKISSSARKDIERLFAKKVFLQVWVRVKKQLD